MTSQVDDSRCQSRIVLIASSDDFLLEESVNAVVEELRRSLPDAEVERLPEAATPSDVAMELRSPSLFAAARILVVPDVRAWLDTTAPQGALADIASADDEPLCEALASGAPDATALVMGSWCGRRPKGRLVEAVEAVGTFTWVPLPEPPKPWEDVTLSQDQRRVLVTLLKRFAGEVRFTRDAEALLLDRLGFDPRRLVQEARKLVAAAGAERAVDEELVRRLVFPRQRSLEVVRDAVLQRDPAPLLELVAAAAAGAPITDWQGRPLPLERLGTTLFGQVANLLSELLYLRRVAAGEGLLEEMAPERTAADRWYQRSFSRGTGPRLVALLGRDGPTPLDRKGKPPSTWTLGQLFRGAGHYRDDELVAALAAAGEVEHAQRGAMSLEALAAWLARSIGSGLRG